MDNLFQLRRKNDNRLKGLDFETRDTIRSMMNYYAQYDLSRYRLEQIRSELLDKTLKTKKLEIKDIKDYCDKDLSKRKLSQYSLKNFFLIEYYPMILFFFILVIIMIHFGSTWFAGTNDWLNVKISYGFPLFMLIQYFSIVFLLYLERRFSLENKSKKNLASFANIFVVLTVIQFMTDNVFLSSTMITLNLFLLMGLCLLMLVWTIYHEYQSK